MIKIQKIEANQTHFVRQAVLRPGKPIETCFFDGDELATTFHLGALENEIILGVLSVYLQENPKIQTKRTAYQLRGMAILESHQKMGIGKLLLEFAQKTLLEKPNTLLWFNARASAVGFYEKLGFKTHGEIFEIPDVGPHFLMYK